MDSFHTRLETTLSTYYTWSKIKDAQDDNEKLKEVALHCNIDSLKGLIYLYDHSLYRVLWSKPPSQGCLVAAIKEICA